jgi:hypothetical protein
LPDPVELFTTAWLLIEGETSVLSDARLRRAVSTAYYALYHKVVRAAAERFLGLGEEKSPAYTLLYRSFDHRHMRAICESLNVSTLNVRLQMQLGRTAMSQDLRDFASTFPTLQQARHRADYDPSVRFNVEDVFDLIAASEAAAWAFERVDIEERTDVLALMIAKTRA